MKNSVSGHMDVSVHVRVVKVRRSWWGQTLVTLECDGSRGEVSVGDGWFTVVLPVEVSTRGVAS